MANSDRTAVALLLEVEVRPYNVLGRRYRDKKRQPEQSGPDPASLECCVIVDNARLAHIQPPGNPRSASSGPSASIYKWLGIDQWEAFPDDVVHAVYEVGQAKYHRYRYFNGATNSPSESPSKKAPSPRKGTRQAPIESASTHVVHCVLPTATDVSTHSRADAVSVLAKAFAAVFKEVAGSGRRTLLRLAPPSPAPQDDARNAFSGANLPSVTADAIALACKLVSPCFANGKVPVEVSEPEAAAAENGHMNLAVELCVDGANQHLAFAAALKEVQRAALAREYEVQWREAQRQDELCLAEEKGAGVYERAAEAAKAVVEKSEAAWEARQSEVTELRNFVRNLTRTTDASDQQARDEQATAVAALARSTDGQETARATLEAAREKLIEALAELSTVRAPVTEAANKRERANTAAAEAEHQLKCVETELAAAVAAVSRAEEEETIETSSDDDDDDDNGHGSRGLEFSATTAASTVPMTRNAPTFRSSLPKRGASSLGDNDAADASSSTIELNNSSSMHESSEGATPSSKLPASTMDVSSGPGVPRDANLPEPQVKPSRKQKGKLDKQQQKQRAEAAKILDEKLAGRPKPHEVGHLVMGSKSTIASKAMAKALAPTNKSASGSSTSEDNHKTAAASLTDSGHGALPSFMYASVDPSLLARCSKVKEKDTAAKAEALANSFGALLASTIDAAGLTLAALFRLSDTGGGKGGGDGLLDYGEISVLVRGALNISKSELSESDLRTIFKVMDDDSSGHVSRGELAAFVKRGRKARARQQASNSTTSTSSNLRKPRQRPPLAPYLSSTSDSDALANSPELLAAKKAAASADKIASLLWRVAQRTSLQKAVAERSEEARKAAEREVFAHAAKAKAMKDEEETKKETGAGNGASEEIATKKHESSANVVQRAWLEGERAGRAAALEVENDPSSKTITAPFVASLFPWKKTGQKMSWADFYGPVLERLGVTPEEKGLFSEEEWRAVFKLMSLGRDGRLATPLVRAATGNEPTGASGRAVWTRSSAPPPKPAQIKKKTTTKTLGSSTKARTTQQATMKSQRQELAGEEDVWSFLRRGRAVTRRGGLACTGSVGHYLDATSTATAARSGTSNELGNSNHNNQDAEQEEAILLAAEAAAVAAQQEVQRAARARARAFEHKLGGTLKEAVGREVSAAVLRDAVAATLTERVHVAAVLAQAANLASLRSGKSLEELVDVPESERHATVSAEVADRQTTAAAAMGLTPLEQQARAAKRGDASGGKECHGDEKTQPADTASQTSWLLGRDELSSGGATAEQSSEALEAVEEEEPKEVVLASYEQYAAIVRTNIGVGDNMVGNALLMKVFVALIGPHSNVRVVGSCINGAVDVERLREFVVSGEPKVVDNGKAHAKSRAKAAERIERDRVRGLQMALAHQDAANSRKFTRSSTPNLHGDYEDSDDDSFLELAQARNNKRSSAATKKRLEHERRLAEATVVPPPPLDREYTSQSLVATSPDNHALENYYDGNSAVDIEADAWPPPPAFASNAHEATIHAACRSVPPPPNNCAAVINGDGFPGGGYLLDSELGKLFENAQSMAHEVDEYKPSEFFDKPYRPRRLPVPTSTLIPFRFT